jgi:HD-like signal output (HDOD) protein/ActR/RegA family two-component response regulator
MSSVLFVDDEPFILGALQNALRRQRNSWDMCFVGSAEAALEALAACPRDIVVADMRMPGMDGIELLAAVRSHHPQTLRVMLTGESSGADLARALPVTQQVLSKPCETAQLCGAIERLFGVQQLIGDSGMRARINGLGALAAFPKCYLALSHAMERADVSVATIAAMVEEDPVLSAKVLSVANSVGLGAARQTTSVHLAVQRIGFELLRGLALAAEIHARIDPALPASRWLGDVSRRSQRVARLARHLCADRRLADEAFTAGLLLDVGSLVLAQCFGQEYLDLAAGGAAGMQALADAERRRYGLTHAEAGAYLLGSWGLAPTLVAAVAGHHNGSALASDAGAAAVAAHIADCVLEALAGGTEDPLRLVAPEVCAEPGLRARVVESLEQARIMVQEA